MEGKEVREIREKLDLTREEFATFLCLSGYQSMMNIETEFRNLGKFSAKILRYLDSLPKNKAKAFIDETNRHDL